MISVIVPVYRVEHYLNRCVESILCQTYSDIEVLLIDDGSPDRCGQICDEYEKQDCRVKAFHTENRGLSAARNLGLQNAEGEYIGFVDSDDWIEPGMYENLLKGLEETDSDVCVCDYFLEPAKYKMNHQSGVVIYQDADAVKALMDGKINNFVWNKLYRKEVFKDILFPVGKNYEDIAIMHRILFKAERVAVIPNVEYHYCFRFDSITRTHSAKNMLDYAEAFLKRYFFLSNCQNKSYSYKQQEIMRLPAIGISAVWRWWYGCSLAEKKTYKGKVDDLLKFSREHFPMFGYSSWPGYLRISTVFMHSGSNMSFAVLYGLNQLYRRIRLGKK